MAGSEKGRARYALKEVFLTLQGEGLNAGRAAVFARFAGCNLWNGLADGRESAACRFCDTDFVGTDGENGGAYDLGSLIRLVDELWAGGDRGRFIVLTGGEPLLQVDEALIDALHERGYEIAVETNGTVAPPRGIDWVCVSPKGSAPLVLQAGDELKLVFPQHDARPERFTHLPFRHFLLQPMDGPGRAQATSEAIAYCLAHPQWRLSTQTHKMLGIP